MLTYDQAYEYIEYNKHTGEMYWKKDVANNVKSGTVAGKVRVRDGYKVFQLFGKQLQAHRVAWLLENKQYPKEYIDHINGNRSDNRICNLREASRSINAQNVRKPSKRNASGYLGVSYKNNAYEASLTVKNKSIYLGRFKNPEDAYAAYLNAKRKHHQGCTI